MSNELVQLQGNVSDDVSNNAIATYEAVDTGLGDAVRIKPTELKLIQPMTQETFGGQMGQILDVLEETAFNSLTVVPLRIWRTRAKFPAGSDFSRGAKPECRSNDGKVPSPFAEVPQAASCASCPHSQWAKKNGKPVKPACAEKYRMLVIRKDTGLPRYLTVGGMSIKSLKPVLERIQQNIVMAQRTGQGVINLFDFYFTLASEKAQKGTPYWIMRFNDVKRVRDLGEFGPLFEEYVVKYREALEAEAEAEADGSVDAAVGNAIDVQGEAVEV